MTDKLMIQMTQQRSKDLCHREIDLTILSIREKEVLVLIADGISNKVIADHLLMYENTIKAHVQNILKKLHLRSRVQVSIVANENIEQLKQLI